MNKTITLINPDFTFTPTENITLDDSCKNCISSFVYSNELLRTPVNPTCKNFCTLRNVFYNI